MSDDTSAYTETLSRFARELAANSPTPVPGYVFMDTPEGKMVQLQWEYEQLQSIYRKVFEELTEEHRQATILRDRYENVRGAAEQLARERDEARDALARSEDLAAQELASAAGLDAENERQKDELLKARNVLYAISEHSCDPNAVYAAERALRS